MAEPTSRQLRYLVALSETSHFGEAAAQCGVSQPNLSAQIRELERILGVQLVERTSRSVMLTDVGRDVVERSRAVLRSMDELVDLAARRADPLTGPLRLGVIPTISPYVLPRILPAVRHAFPSLELHLTEDFTDRLLTRLSNADLDLLLLALPLEQDGLVQRPLIQEPFVLVAPREHRLASTDRITPEDVDSDEMLLLSEGHCLRDQAIEACNVDRAARHRIIEGSSLSTLVQMVANGLGVTLLPRAAVNVDIGNNDEVVVRPFEEPQPGRTIGLAWRATSPRVAAFTQVADLLQREIAPLVN
jgi:LysR family hydrogen peroxide-inducible transcriptional activator